MTDQTTTDTATTTAEPWPALQAPYFYGQLAPSAGSTAGALAHIWRPSPTGRSRDRAVSSCGMVSTSGPHHVEPDAAGVAMCHQCRQFYTTFIVPPAPRPISPAAAAELGLDRLGAGAAVLMTATEARAATAAINTALGDLRSLISDFDEREGWRALGYESFRAWAVAEVSDVSLRHVYRLRDAAEVDRSLGVTIGHTPESHARELAPVAPAERPAVLERAAEIAGGGPVQAKHIAEARAPFAVPADLVAAGVLVEQLSDTLWRAVGTAGLMAGWSSDAVEKPAHAVLAARVVISERATSAAETALIDAQNASPGSVARDELLGRASDLIKRLAVGPARDELSSRWSALHAEHVDAFAEPVVEPADDGEALQLHTPASDEPGYRPPVLRADTLSGSPVPVGDDPAEQLVWDLVEMMNAGERPAVVRRALHTARQLVAHLEIASDTPADLQTAAVYHRVVELERGRGPLNAVELRDVDDALSALEDLAGSLDDAAYEDLSRRLSAVRRRGKAAA